MSEMIQVLCAGFGTFGFSILFRVRAPHLPVAALGGVLSWTCYLLVSRAGGTIFFTTLISAMAVCLWAETMARLRKAPATVFLVPGIIPLIPGSALYYAMDGLVSKDMSTFVAKGGETLFVAVGIAGGILFASEIVRVVTRAWDRHRNRQVNVNNDPKGQ